MKTIIEFFQEQVGATHPIQDIIYNLDIDEISELFIKYNQLQIEERLKYAEYQDSLV